MLGAAYYMRRALEFASLSIGLSRPNPAVGAVVVRNGNIVGMGRTQAPGSSHAEVMALRDAGEEADGADLYVTLEPCCHYGRTPPCTSAIINAKIKRVFYAHRDPNPVVRGNSRRILEDAGIEVFEALEACGGDKAVFNAVERFFEAYDFFVRYKRTFVELKSAVTKNFKMANCDKSPMQITGDKANVENHWLRAISDAVLVGASTVVHDDPSLNVRLCNGNSPVRIVMANKTVLPGDRKIFSRFDNVAEPLKSTPQVIVFSACAQPELQKHVDAGLVETVPLVGKDFAENWNIVLENLSVRGMHRLMVEPGAELAQCIFKTKLWNRLDLWISDFERVGFEYPQLPECSLITEERFGCDSLRVFRQA